MTNSQGWVIIAELAAIAGMLFSHTTRGRR